MDFKSSPSGNIKISIKNYPFFIPHPLPPDLVWSENLMLTLSRADFLIGQLSREGSRLPDPHLFTRSFVTREAVFSSRIEGTQATIAEVLAHEAGVPNQSHEDIQEIQNYISALDFGLQRLNEIPLSLRLIKEMHYHLMQGVRGNHATPGEFRKSQNWIGPPGCTLNTASFIPPSPEHLLDSLSQLEKFLHSDTLPPLIHNALCHYQFETIHPFLDGNGRVGRLLITLLLIQKGILPQPTLYLSAFFEATRDEYYRQLSTVRKQGSWESWLIYFLNGVAVQSEDALSKAERMNAIIDSWIKRITSSGSKIPLEIIHQLATNPYVKISTISENLQIAFSTAKRAIEKLESMNILKKIDEKKRNKTYCAYEILKLLEESPII